MRTWILALTCGMALVAHEARAAVDGLVFKVTVESNVDGVADTIIEFNADGEFEYDADNGQEGDGTYTQSGAFITVITGTGDNGDGYTFDFTATVIDPKQLPGILGEMARENGTPATIRGRGTGSKRDRFKFSGEELVP